MKQTIKASTEYASSIPAIAANPPRSSFDPIVAEVHAIRQAMLDKFGGNTRAWFDDLLDKQSQHRAAKLQ
jgi:hypothetical protein